MSNVWAKVQQYLKDQEEKIVKNQDSENAKPCDHSLQIPESMDQPKPYLRPSGELVIPLNSHPKYHYWRGGQNLLETLLELGADEETIRRYVDGDIEKQKRLIH